MASKGSASFHRHFQDLRDPRIERTRKHPLINIIFIAVCGVLSGANSIAGIHEFAFDRRTWFARYLDLTNGIPSEDTIGRVLARAVGGVREMPAELDPGREGVDHAPPVFWRSMARRFAVRPITSVAEAAIHMVSAWAVENKLSLGQVVVQEKSNEITAIPELLQLLDISGGW